MIEPKNVSCCLITKDPTYPHEILSYLSTILFGEILILTGCDSPFRKHELFAKAKFDYIYYQDDDALCAPTTLMHESEAGIINVAMKEGHFNAHKNNRATMGLGWGSLFPKSLLTCLKRYTDVYGEDDVFKRETERIFTYLCYPQNRLVLPIQDLPSAWGNDRLWRQPDHQKYKVIAEERCEKIINEKFT